jgi:hypothetical protein
MEFTSSWEHGGFLELAAILKGLKKQDTKTSSCSMYSSSASTIRNTKLKTKTCNTICTGIDIKDV